MQMVLPFSDIASSLAHEQQLIRQQQERRGSTSSSTPRSPLSVREIDDKRNTPLFRRDSTTEEILLPDLIDETCSSWGESSTSSVLSAIDEEGDGSMKDLFASGFKTACNHLYDTFTAPPPAAHQPRHDQKLLLVLGQKGSERRKARAVVCNHDEFLKLKKELKESGMVTNYAARAVLNPIVESRAADLIMKNRRRQQREMKK